MYVANDVSYFCESVPTDFGEKTGMKSSLHVFFGTRIINVLRARKLSLKQSWNTLHSQHLHLV